MTGRKRGRRLGTALLVIGAAYVAWLAITIARFKPPRAASPAGARAGGPPHEVVGAYHVHTKFSDGHATPEEVAAAAAGRRLDFVILTDHGNPNRQSLASQGWKRGVLMLAGSELSVNRGHLVALGFEPPPAGRAFPQNAEQAAIEVAAAGGFTVIAHPYSKTHWTWGEEIDVSGIELTDVATMIRWNTARFLLYAPAYLFRPGLPLLKTLSRPVQPLRKWDSLAAQHPVYGYFSADAHLGYSAIFGCFRIHAQLDEPLAADFERARAQVFGALRRGRFYSAVEGAESAGGFGFSAEAGGEAFPMGSEFKWRDGATITLKVRAPFAFPIETRLIRDGEVIERGNGGEQSYAADRPGVYRVEVYLKTRSPLAADFPWIVSNPIFLRRS